MRKFVAVTVRDWRWARPEERASSVGVYGSVGGATCLAKRRRFLLAVLGSATSCAN